MLTRVDVQNYRSIYKASIALSPFTLLIGANGTGKSNFLQLLKEASILQNPSQKHSNEPSKLCPFPKHHSFSSEDQLISIYSDNGQRYDINSFRSEPISSVKDESVWSEDTTSYMMLGGDAAPARTSLSELTDVRVFRLEPYKAGLSEILVPQPTIKEDGTGLVQVLDSLKTGDREDLFNRIEKTLMQYIPEIEKLSFVPGHEYKKLQVRERHIPHPVPVSLLSQGTQLALLITAILYQEHRPSLVCIEDIGHGLHPRLFQHIIQLCFDLSQWENGVQIIATTHNPYLVDEFIGHESAVVIVEKEGGQSKFTTLSERLEVISPVEVPLGSLWYSGLLGGVSQRAS